MAELLAQANWYLDSSLLSLAQLSPSLFLSNTPYYLQCFWLRGIKSHDVLESFISLTSVHLHQLTVDSSRGSSCKILLLRKRKTLLSPSETILDPEPVIGRSGPGDQVRSPTLKNSVFFCVSKLKTEPPATTTSPSRKTSCVDHVCLSHPTSLLAEQIRSCWLFLISPPSQEQVSCV